MLADWMADSSQKMGVSCAGQAGISCAPLGQSKIGEARGAQRRSHCRLPPRRSRPGPATGLAKKEREGGRERERERERERKREGGRERRAELAELSGSRGQTLDQHLDLRLGVNHWNGFSIRRANQHAATEALEWFTW